MKVGFRKPSIKKSIKARTTGKLKRQVKKAATPGYGKKGMGWAKSPKKAMYNKIYNKTTIGVSDLAPTGKKKSTKAEPYDAPRAAGRTSPATYRVCGVVMKIIAVCMAVFCLPALFGGMYGLLIFAALCAFVFWKLGAGWSERGKESKEKAPEDVPLEADDIIES